MGKHAILSPSGSHTWSLCLASPALSVGKPNRSSPFADEGTIAHKVSDLCFTTDIDALSLVGKKVKVFEDADEILITDDLARNMDVYVSQVREAAVGKVLYSEQTLPIAHITGEPDAEGTCDNVILSDDEIEIGDLKYGKGVPVKAYRNTQLMIYALAAIDYFSWFADFKTIKIKIYQVRLDNEPSVWTCTREELEEFRIEIRKKAERAAALIKNPSLIIDADYCPSKGTCQFCKAKPCKKMEEFTLSAIADDFDVESPEADSVIVEQIDNVKTCYPIERVAEVAKKIELFKQFILAIETRLHSTMMAGEKVAGWKLVQGRDGFMKWTDETKVEAELKGMGISEDKIFERKMLTPAKIRDTYAKKKGTKEIWEKVHPLTFKPKGKINVVPESDPRQAVVPSNDCSDDFAIEGDEE